MTPLIAGIIGALIGLLSSPNPLLAIICSAFFAAIGWALTGFNIGAPTSTATDLTKAERSRVVNTGPSFLIEGQGRVSAKQLGVMFVKQSYELTIVTVDMLFKPGKSGVNLPLSESVAANPLPARLFFAAMLIAAYFIYPMKKLRVDERTRLEMMDGSIGALADLKKPDGTLFGQEDLQAVKSLIVSFYDFMAADFDRPKDTDGSNQTTRAPPKSTELLLSILVSHYNGGGLPSETAVAQLKKRGFYDPAYALATQTIDDLAYIPSKTLSDLNTKIFRA